MATRNQVNDLSQQYLGRDAEPSGLDYWTSQDLSLSGIEYNIANSPEAQAKTASYLPSVSGLGGGVTIKGIPVGFGLFSGSGSPLTFPTDLLIDEATQGKFFQQFIDIFRPYVEGQDVDDPDRVNRANEASRWLNLLAKYAEGDATQEDLQNFDAEFLSEIPAWNEYYSGIVGGAETTVDESEQVTEQDAKKILSNIFGSEDAVPQSALTGIMGPTGPLASTLGRGCSYKGTPKEWEWWRQCVSLHVLVPILGLPELPSAVLGGILQSTTIGEIEDALRNIGKKVSDVFSDPEYSWEDAVGDLGEWVINKVEAAGDILDPSGITIEDVLGTLGGAASSIIIQGVVNEVKDGLGIPVFVTTDEKCQAAGTKEDPDNPGQCLPTGVVDYGMCDDNLTAKLNEEGTNCPPGQSIPQEGENCFTENNEAGTITNVGGELKCVPNAVSDPACQDPNAQNYGEIGDCGECKAGYSRKPGQTDCTKDDGGGGDDVFDLPCPEGHKRFNGECDLPCPTNPSIAASDPRCGGGGDDGGGTTTGTPTFTVVCGQKEPYAPTGNAVEYNAAYREYEAEYNEQCLDSGGGDTGNGGDGGCPAKGTVLSQGCQGTTFVIEFADGECGVIEDSVPNYSFCAGGGDDTTSTGGGTTFNCISQNRQTNEDGSCGACLPGYSPDPNNFDECVKDDTVVGGEPPGPTEPPATSSGGGGAVGGGAGGMFTGTVSGLSYMPQALPGIQTPAPVNAMASLEGLIGRMLTGNIS